MNDLPECVRLYTTREFDPLGVAKSVAGHLSLKRKNRENGVKAATVVTPGKEIFKKLSQTYKNWAAIPDDHWGWYPFAVRLGQRIIREQGIDAIFTTSGPYTAHLIGLRLKQLTGKAWLADFRDNWMRNVYIQFPTPLHRRIHRALERRVFLQADAVTTVQSDVYDPADLALDKSKFIHLTNGFDEADFSSLQRATSDNFTITFTGSFYASISPESFLRGLRALLDERPALRPQVRVRIFGHSYDIDVAHLAAQLGLEKTVDCLGVVPYHEALQAMVNADVLLLILFDSEHSSNQTVYSGKLFEYLGAGRPILGIMSPKGVAADIIRQTGSGVVAPPGDVPAIKEALGRLYDQWQAGALAVPAGRDLRPYSRRGLTQKLAGVLDAVSGNR